MNDTICTKMGGAKCAGNYCDFWDDERQECSEATESKMRCAMMEVVLSRLEELLLLAKDKEDVKKIIAEMNIVNLSNTRH